jgi:hypothetical protein
MPIGRPDAVLMHHSLLLCRCHAQQGVCRRHLMPLSITTSCC